MDISSKLEALLFFKAEPISFKRLSVILDIGMDELKTCLDKLEEDLQGRGITLVRNDEEVALGTAKELSSFIEEITKEELNRDLGRAGLETLSIILYQGPISRTDIDYIRGVNSQFILRNLLIRGLVERVPNPKDARGFLYKTTIQLLSELGISKITDLPEYEKVKSDIEAFKQSTSKEEIC